MHERRSLRSNGTERRFRTAGAKRLPRTYLIISSLEGRASPRHALSFPLVLCRVTDPGYNLHTSLYSLGCLVRFDIDD